MLKVKKYIKQKDIKWSFLICLGVSLLAVPFISLIAAFIVNLTDDPTANIGLCSLLTMIASAVFSGAFISLYKKDSSVGFAALVTLCVVLIMLLIGAVFCNGKLSASAFMNYGCYFGVACISAYLIKNKKGRRRHTR